MSMKVTETSKLHKTAIVITLKFLFDKMIDDGTFPKKLKSD